ncbi:MAG: hypothetical protein Q9202_006191 [Teloschistes flavicans]
MQTLWVRLTQSRCLFRSSTRQFSSAALTRPSVASPIRLVGVDNVFAFFFATAAFASAVVDSARKDARKKEWVRVIKEARRELHTLEAEQERRLSNLKRTGGHDVVEEKDDTTSVRQDTWEDVLRSGHQELRERRELGFTNWQGIPLSRLRNASSEQIRDFCENHSNQFNKFRGKDGVEVWNTVTWPLHIRKLKTVEWSIAKLVFKLMRDAPEERTWLLSNDSIVAKRVLAHYSCASTDSYKMEADCQDQLNTLSQGQPRSDEYYLNFLSPRFPRYSVSWDRACWWTAPSSADELNAKLNDLFESHKKNSDNINTRLPSICYYLLTSKTPPDIHTYNLLASEFVGAGRNRWVRNLLISTWETHMRPNEITLAETLRYFVRINDRVGFKRQVRRMEADTQSLLLAHPEEDIPDLVRFQYRVCIEKFTPDGGLSRPSFHEMSDLSLSDIQTMKENGRVTVYMKTRRSPEVYRALIEGAMHFHGLSGAIAHYKDMTSEGWNPDEGMFFSIMSRCVAEREWEAGFAIWRHLHANDIFVSENVYILMIQLCRRCQKLDMIIEIIHMGVYQGALPPTILERSLRFSMNIEEDKIEEEFSVAQELWIMKRGLEGLLQDARGGDEVSPKLFEEIDVISSEIGRSLEFPDSKTAALLMEARTLLLTAKLGQLKQQLLDLASNLYGLWFSVRVEKLEEAVGKLGDRIRSIHLEKSLIMTVLPRLGPSVLKTISSFVEMQLDNLQVTIRRTSREVNKVMIDVYGEAGAAALYRAVEYLWQQDVETNAGALAQQKPKAQSYPHRAFKRIRISSV